MHGALKYRQIAYRIAEKHAFSAMRFAFVDLHPYLRKEMYYMLQNKP